MEEREVRINLEDFLSRELLERFEEMAVGQGTSGQAVLAGFIRDYIVSGGHPEEVANRHQAATKGCKR